MRNKWTKNLIKFLGITLTVLCIFGLVSRPVSLADELSDITKQLQNKQKEKEETVKKIKDIEKNISTISGQRNNLYNTLASLKSQQNELNTQITTLEQQILEQEALLNDYSTKLEESKARILENQNYLYKLSFLNPDIFDKEIDLNEYYQQASQTNVEIDIFRGEINSYTQKIATVNTYKSQITEEKNLASTTKQQLESEISKTSQEIAANEKKLAEANASKSNLNTKLNELDGQIKFMGAKQKELMDAELRKMQSASQVTRTEIKDGQYFFMGRGRDMIEGHGLGMSQWGAYGMAQKGWNAEQILKFYYTGVTIGEYQEPEMIIVDGKMTTPIPFDDYLAGIGEVPNSWPSEVIKAQIIAARTYAMRAAYRDANGVYHICGTDACQVYLGGTAKRDYVLATKGKVILYDGKPITAYYSASHRGHSSKISSVWGSSDLPYIQPVNDDAYAFKDYKSPNPYNPKELISTYNWTWRTNGYSKEQLTEIFSKNSRTNVGTFQSIAVQKDVAGRVSNITLTGSSGTKTLTGWDFRAIFNASTPYNDYVYSTEFQFYQK